MVAHACCHITTERTVTDSPVRIWQRSRLNFRRSPFGLALSAPAWSGPPFIREGKENTAFLFSLSLSHVPLWVPPFNFTLTVKSQSIVIGPILRSTASDSVSFLFFPFFLAFFVCFLAGLSLSWLRSRATCSAVCLCIVEWRILSFSGSNLREITENASLLTALKSLALILELLCRDRHLWVWHELVNRGRAMAWGSIVRLVVVLHTFRVCTFFFFFFSELSYGRFEWGLGLYKSPSVITKKNKKKKEQRKSLIWSCQHRVWVGWIMKVYIIPSHIFLLLLLY